MTSDATRLVLWDIEGNELRRAKLDFRSAVPWPCEELGVTRMDGFRPTRGESQADLLGGREGARDVGRELITGSPPG